MIGICHRAAGLVACLAICLVVHVPAAGAAGPFEKNHAAVKAAFREAVARASAATVRVRSGGEDVALGAIVDPNGYVVSKASLLDGELTCRLKDGRELEAKIVATDQDHDLALLKLDADNLSPVPWRAGSPPPGSLIAAVGTGDDPLAIGVVSTEPRRITGSTAPNRPKGWLGISVGSEAAGPDVTRVYPGSAAQKAGVQVGDRIKRIDGKTMASSDQVVDAVGGYRPGNAIKLLLERGGREIELSATLGKRRGGWEPQDDWGGGPFSDRRWGFPIALPHDAIVHPDKCGGPLVDTDGNVVGINIARALRVTSYAIPADTVNQVFQSLREKELETPENN